MVQIQGVFDGLSAGGPCVDRWAGGWVSEA